MNVENKEILFTQVKEMLVKNLRLKVEPESIQNDDSIFGDKLGLDSIDALELVVAIEKRFKVRIPDAEVGVKVLATIETLVDFIIEDTNKKNG